MGVKSYRVREAVPKRYTPQTQLRLRLEEDDLIAEAMGILEARMRRTKNDPLISPERTAQYLTLRIGELPYEVFGCLFLDNRHRVIEAVELFRGTIDSAAVHPREVVVEALAHSAAAVILYHSVPRNKMIVLCPVSLCAENGRSRRQSRTADRHQGT